MSPAYAGLNPVFSFTHSLRCGLEECRQLCWLRFTFVHICKSYPLKCGHTSFASRVFPAAEGASTPLCAKPAHKWGPRRLRSINFVVLGCTVSATIITEAAALAALPVIASLWATPAPSAGSWCAHRRRARCAAPDDAAPHPLRQKN